MFPSWARGMLIRTTILGLLVLGIVTTVWLVSGSLASGQKGPGETAKAVTQRRAVPEVGPSRPRLASLVTGQDSQPQKEKARTPGKPSTLAEAISLVESTGPGKVLRAEKAGESNTLQFHLDVLDPNGVRGRWKVTAEGQLTRESGSSSSNPKPTRFRSPGTTTIQNVRLISMQDAIGLVEKAGKGVVIKAERLGEGNNVQFDMAVLDQKGARAHFAVNATGMVIVETFAARGKTNGKRKGSGESQR